MTQDKAYSVASIGKAHLAKMNLLSLREKQPNFPPEVDGAAMESFYGGRVECHNRFTIQPVTYLDVLSMYPVCGFILQKLWWLFVAAQLRVIEAADEVRDLIDGITLETLFDKNIWPLIPGLVLLEPDYDVLPVRADYNGSGSFQIGLNELRMGPIWYTVADAINSKLRTGRTPKILRAIRLRPDGIQPGLRPIKLRGRTLVDPASQDFFKIVIEARHAVRSQGSLSAEDDAYQKFLKTLASSTAYGSLCEFNEESRDKGVTLRVFGGTEFKVQTAWFEKPGRYCNPYIATSVTGAARLVLSMLELAAAEEGAGYVGCDTDAATLIDPDGTVGNRLVKKFEALNPCDFKGSILKIEPENYLPGTTIREPLYGLQIASKRYVLFNRDPKSGEPIIRKALEHGLGHLIPPKGETNESWIERFWYQVLCRHEGRKSEEPAWFNDTMLSQLTISSPDLLKRFPKNDLAIPSEVVAPFNFMLVAYTDSAREGDCQKHGAQWIGCRDLSPCRYRAMCPLVEPIRPVTKYTKHPADIHKLPWWDAHTPGERLAIDPPQPSGISGRVRLKTFADKFDEFVKHAEAKAADANGCQATGETVGKLYRLRIEPRSRNYIGQESRNLGSSEAFGNANKAVLQYDPGVPALRERLARQSPTRVSRISGVSRRQVYAILDPQSEVRCHPETYRALLETLDWLERGQRSR